MVYKRIGDIFQVDYTPTYIGKLKQLFLNYFSKTLALSENSLLIFTTSTRQAIPQTDLIGKLTGDTMKTFPIHFKNGATVCTPDNVAIKTRVSRCKRILRANVKSHKEYLKMARQQTEKQLSFKAKLIDGLLGSAIGVVCFVGPFFLVTL